jgi:plasmid stability protein
MIRGIDKALQRAVKRRAKIEGQSIGGWVRRVLSAALRDSPGQDAATLAARLEAVESRIEAMERFQFELADRLRTESRAGGPQHEEGR